MMEYFYFRIKEKIQEEISQKPENRRKKIKAPAFEGNPWL